MSAEILADLRARGIELSRRGEKLHVVADADVLDAATKDIIRANKAALLAALSEDPTCPTCHIPGVRLGSWTSDAGLGRFRCAQCGEAFAALAERIEFVGWDAGLSDEQYYAVVDADIARFGFYRSNRDYSDVGAKRAGGVA